jgi:hypothetical protein
MNVLVCAKCGDALRLSAAPGANEVVGGAWTTPPEPAPVDIRQGHSAASVHEGQRSGRPEIPTWRWA